MKVTLHQKIAFSLTLLFGLHSAVVADSTRVEHFHQQKSHHKNLKVDRHKIDRPHRLGERQSRPDRVKPHHLYRKAEHRRDGVHHRARPHRVVPAHSRVGHRVSKLHHKAYRFRHAGKRYYYRSGIFYRPHNHGYRVVMAPIGAIIFNLPLGYTRISFSNRSYYEYNNVFYRWDRGAQGYRVVRDPFYNQPYHYRAGDMVDVLPRGAVKVIIDGRRYYEYNNYYFRPKRRAGVQMYLVVDF